MNVAAVRDRIGLSGDHKRFMKILLLTGAPFGIFMGIFWAFAYGAKSAVVLGTVAGLLFGVVMSAFAGYQKKKFQMLRPLSPDEELVKEGGANHFKNFEAVGGWIYLTNERLFFKSHSINLQRHELSIPLQEISDARLCRTFGIVPNGLEIQTVDGKREKFVVEDREDWVKKILERKGL